MSDLDDIISQAESELPPPVNQPNQGEIDDILSQAAEFLPPPPGQNDQSIDDILAEAAKTLPPPPTTQQAPPPQAPRYIDPMSMSNTAMAQKAEEDNVDFFVHQFHTAPDSKRNSISELVKMAEGPNQRAADKASAYLSQINRTNVFLDSETDDPETEAARIRAKQIAMSWDSSGKSEAELRDLGLDPEGGWMDNVLVPSMAAGLQDVAGGVMGAAQFASNMNARTFEGAGNLVGIEGAGTPFDYLSEMMSKARRRVAAKANAPMEALSAADEGGWGVADTTRGVVRSLTSQAGAMAAGGPWASIGMAMLNEGNQAEIDYTEQLNAARATGDKKAIDSLEGVGKIRHVTQSMAIEGSIAAAFQGLGAMGQMLKKSAPGVFKHIGDDVIAASGGMESLFSKASRDAITKTWKRRGIAMAMEIFEENITEGLHLLNKSNTYKGELPSAKELTDTMRDTTAQTVLTMGFLGRASDAKWAIDYIKEYKPRKIAREQMLTPKGVEAKVVTDPGIVAKAEKVLADSETVSRKWMEDEVGIFGTSADERLQFAKDVVVTAKRIESDIARAKYDEDFALGLQENVARDILGELENQLTEAQEDVNVAYEGVVEAHQAPDIDPDLAQAMQEGEDASAEAASEMVDPLHGQSRKAVTEAAEGLGLDVKGKTRKQRIQAIREEMQRRGGKEAAVSEYMQRRIREIQAMTPKELKAEAKLLGIKSGKASVNRKALLRHETAIVQVAKEGGRLPKLQAARAKLEAAVEKRSDREAKRDKALQDFHKQYGTHIPARKANGVASHTYMKAMGIIDSIDSGDAGVTIRPKKGMKKEGAIDEPVLPTKEEAQESIKQAIEDGVLEEVKAEDDGSPLTAPDTRESVRRGIERTDAPPEFGYMLPLDYLKEHGEKKYTEALLSAAKAKTKSAYWSESTGAERPDVRSELEAWMEIRGLKGKVVVDELSETVGKGKHEKVMVRFLGRIVPDKKRPLGDITASESARGYDDRVVDDAIEVESNISGTPTRIRNIRKAMLRGENISPSVLKDAKRDYPEAFSEKNLRAEKRRIADEDKKQAGYLKARSNTLTREQLAGMTNTELKEERKARGLFGDQATTGDQMRRSILKDQEALAGKQEEAEAPAEAPVKKGLKKAGKAPVRSGEVEKGTIHIGNMTDRDEDVYDMDADQLRKMAMSSHVTDLPNRLALNQVGEGKYISFIDVDGLKFVNDAFNHEIGNQLLERIAYVFKEVNFDVSITRGSKTRPSIFHISGDEFLAQGKSKKEIERKLDEAVKRLQAEPMRFEFNDKEYQFTPGYSFGTAGKSKDVAPAEQLGTAMNAAEAIMGKEKEGRERKGLRAKRGMPPPDLARIEDDGSLTPIKGRADAPELTFPDDGDEGAAASGAIKDLRESDILRADETTNWAKVSSLKVDAERFQFKVNTNKHGVRDTLEGPWDSDAAGIVFVWRDPKGNLWVINGHHRIELAKRENVKEVRTLVMDHTQYSERQAMRRAAKINILEGKGTIDDQVNFWRNSTEEELAIEEARSGSHFKRTNGYRIARYATDRLVKEWRKGGLDDGVVAALADAYPHDSDKQAIGVSYAREYDEITPSGAVTFVRMMDGAKRKQEGYSQSSLFGADVVADMEGAMADMIAEANRRAKHLRGIASFMDKTERSKEGFAEIFKEIKVVIKTPKDLDRHIAKYKEEAAMWARFDLHPEYLAEIKEWFQEVNGAPPDTEIETVDPELREDEDQEESRPPPDDAGGLFGGGDTVAEDAGKADSVDDDYSISDDDYGYNYDYDDDYGGESDYDGPDDSRWNTYYKRIDKFVDDNGREPTESEQEDIREEVFSGNDAGPSNLSVTKRKKGFKRAEPENLTEDDLELPVNMSPKDKVNEDLPSAQAIIRRIARMWGANLRFGQLFKGHQAAGQHLSTEEAIAIRSHFSSNIPVAMHEVAHQIDAAMDMRKKFPESIQAELKALDYDQNKDTGQRTFEGFAEFIRMYYTGRRNEVSRMAPGVVKWWNGMMESHPEHKQTMSEIEGLVDTYREASPLERVAANINVKGELEDLRSTDEKLLEWAHKLESAMDDRLGYLKRAHGRTYTLGRNLLGTGSGPAEFAIRKGVFVPGTNEKLSEGIYEALEGLSDSQLKAVVWYAYAKHAIDVWGRKDGDRNPGITLKDAQAVVADLGTDAKMVEAAGKLVAYNKALVTMLSKTGAVTTSQAEAIIESYPNYIPLMRLKDKTMLGGRKGMPSSVARATKKGSGDEVLHPIVAMGQMTSRMYEVAHKSIVENSLLDAHLAGELPKGIVTPMEPKRGQESLTVGEIASQMKALGVDVKLKSKGPDGDEYMDIDPDTMLSISRIVRPDSNENIIIRTELNEDGNEVTRWYQIDKEVFLDIDGRQYLPADKAGSFIKMLRFITRAKRLGATGLRWKFGLVKNPSRDIKTALSQTSDRERYGPWTANRSLVEKTKGLLGLNFLSNMPEGARAAWAKHVRGENVYADLLSMGGLEQSNMHFQDTKRSLADLERTVTMANKEGFSLNRLMDEGKFVVMHPSRLMDSVANILSITETMPRAAEFKLVLDRKGWTKERLEKGMRGDGPLPPLDMFMDAMLEAREVTQDFHKGGSFAKDVATMKAFFNSSVQGSMQSMVHRPSKIGWAKWLARGAVYQTVPALAHWLMYHDEPWYDNQEWWEKYLTYKIPVPGTKNSFVHMPKPFDLGFMFAGIPTMIAETIYSDRPDQLKNFLKAWYDSSILPGNFTDVLPDSLQPLVEIWGNRKGFGGGPVVPRSVQHKPEEMQYGRYTLESFKAMGELTGKSPAELEHLARSYTGGAMTDFIGISERMVGLSGDRPWFRTQGRGRSVNELYESHEALSDDIFRAGEKATIEQKAELAILSDMKAMFSAIYKLQDDPKADPKWKTSEGKDELNTYVTGLSMWALGWEPEPSLYPNPLIDDAHRDVKSITGKYLRSRRRGGRRGSKHSRLRNRLVLKRLKRR